MNIRKPARIAGIEAMRREAIRSANDHNVGTPEYETALKAVERLSALIVKESREPLSWNAVLPVVGTLASVILITDFEKLNIITSKAVQFLPKLMK